MLQFIQQLPWDGLGKIATGFVALLFVGLLIILVDDPNQNYPEDEN